MLDGFGIEVGKFAQRQRLRHLNAEEVTTLLGQRGQQRRRFADAGGDNNDVVISNEAYRFSGGCPFLFILRTCRHCFSP